ncbi:sigma70-ECF: RNA polymerase sigma factor, sigma-70 family [Rubrobacter radiotolerans]|uniref:RNA polymerase sigma factor n=1 Tax=Rubrobacter radiotolerans TaxID=42256 RepID=A0A023X633_RUBRA|nr:sigma-70 family RNA polymerase sigma factor [Rubrobacter radiotolerans]AHY47808.1 sigma70-ECF: RNA polymerase sigma factor, sigma-70 family [Rubrobacter radiotolerans]MDX5892447.1 sigma-70 family RNA polymerase sigma factor [Rubrobacter radiotolerans]SMC07738.1 RNA polymerase sigma-70 factor, ECF subfamily [Rubrobacter radiotolerans DSM 5868]
MDHAQAVDEELMEMISGGDETALETLYGRYGGPAYSLAFRIVRDQGAAEEVVQDAFVSVWNRADTYDPASGKLYSWLLAIVRNRAIDELRKPATSRRNAQRTDLREVLEGSVSETSEGVGAEAAWISELREIVRHAVQKLPESQREVIELAYLRGLSQREISEKTGTPLGTVKTRTRLALDKLRRSLEPAIGRTVDLDGM